jgi:hypothetical protein
MDLEVKWSPEATADIEARSSFTHGGYTWEQKDAFKNIHLSQQWRKEFEFLDVKSGYT